MRCRFVFLIVLFSFIGIFPAVSQGVGQGNAPDFFLLPILEVLFSQNVKWRPDWRVDIPPDGFVIPESDRRYELIELSNGSDSFNVRYDRAGKLLEFPFFYSDSYASIRAFYNEDGSLSRMNITLKNYSSAEDSAQEEKTIYITFQNNFLPYSQISPGGEFPPVSVIFNDAVYHIFIFESPLFLTETWFDDEGNILFFCKANVNTDNGAWRIRSMEIQDANGALFVDNFFDSFGNITEIMIEDGIYYSLYAGSMPNLWRFNDQKYELFWDTQSILQVIKASEFIDDIYTEYRYQYDFDRYGNWTRRQETAYIINSNLLAPNPFYSRGIWNRRIVYFE